MTEQEVNEIFNGTRLQFNEYYKYIFSYSGRSKCNNYLIRCSFGGDPDDIYRTNFGPEENFSSVDECSSVNVIRLKDEKEVFLYCDFQERA